MRQFFQSKKFLQPFILHPEKYTTSPSSPKAFTDPGDAFTYIAKWNGSSSHELLAAIHCVRSSGGLLQKYLPDAIARLYRSSLPTELPTACMHGPIWAIDSKGFALIGSLGNEKVLSVEEIKKDLEE